jgi:single-strand DNA-binding protein
MINVVVVAGELSRPAQMVDLPSGDHILALEVTVRRPGAAADPVPVQWAQAPAWARALGAGDEVVVLGRVRRRFFRAGGVTQSRTEVVAARVVRATARARVRALVDEAVDALDGGLMAEGRPAPLGGRGGTGAGALGS